MPVHQFRGGSYLALSGSRLGAWAMHAVHVLGEVTLGVLDSLEVGNLDMNHCIHHQNSLMAVSMCFELGRC